MRRWQKTFLVVTVIFAFLTVDVWCVWPLLGITTVGARDRTPMCVGAATRRFFYSRSLNCCAEVRGFLGCSPSYLDPCREFTGNCGDLLEQFKDVPDSGIPDDYECTQFPDEKSPRDKVIVSLICFAVGLPFAFLIEELFAIRRARGRRARAAAVSGQVHRRW